jgi:hypothetical protein
MESWNHGPGETEKKVSRGKNNGQKRITSVTRKITDWQKDI